MDYDGEIEIRTQPWRLKVGEQVYEFHPERSAEQLVEAQRNLTRIRLEARQLGLDYDSDGNVKLDDSKDGTEVADRTANRLLKLTQANREYLAAMMTAESAERFLADPPPGRVVVEMKEWILERYGGSTRPPTSSSGSSNGSAQAGSRSTEPSASKASTTAGGRSPN